MSTSSRSSSLTQSQFCNYPYQQDAVRVVAQHTNEGQENHRRFSVDPQLTSFDILKNLIGRAFDMKGDFAISYRAMDDYGSEAYLPMVSDWDLSAAFLSASDPDLHLVVEKKDISLDADDGSGDFEEEKWDMISTGDTIPSDVGIGSPLTNSQETAKSQYSQKTDYNTSGFSSQSSLSMISRVSSAYSNPAQYPIAFNTKINTTGLFNAMEKLVQKAKNLYDDLSVVTSRPPLSDVEFRNYLDNGGTLCKPRELRFACYHGGIEPSLRKVVWKHLLNVYPDGLTGNQRMDYVRNKSKDYYELRDAWKGAFQTEEISDDVLSISNMVKKDVLRTDRHLKFFAGHDDNQNIASLFNILTTYSLNHPTTGYCQGMSDLASPLLYTMGDEAQAYICFCSLMDRIKPNFSTDGEAMSLKFTHLAEGLAYYDQQFWLYLKSIGADDLLFCYRWLLLELKREFAFEDALKMMEVMWASLPYKPQDVPLYEVKFTLMNAHAIPIPIPSSALSSSYSKVCAIRRSSTALNAMDIRQRRYSNKKAKGNNPNLSLDENSLSTLSTASSSSVKSHRKPFYSLDESTEIISSSELSTSPFEILSPDAFPDLPKPKLIKNLKEFWQMGRPQSFSSIQDISPSAINASMLSSTASSTYDSLKNASADVDLNGQVFLDDNDTQSEGTTPTEQEQRGLGDSLNTYNTSAFRNGEKIFPFRNLSHSYTEGEGCRMRAASVGDIDLTASTRSQPTTSAYLRHNALDPASTETVCTSKPAASTSAMRTASTSATVNSSHSRPMYSGNSNNGNVTYETKIEGERLSQVGESEPDSGHCFGDSFDSSVEPEFQTGGTREPPKMPSPETLGGGNPFLMFLSLTLLLQHRDHILKNRMDYNETAMYFDKMIRKHNVGRVLGHARQMYSNYLKQNVSHA